MVIGFENAKESLDLCIDRERISPIMRVKRDEPFRPLMVIKNIPFREKEDMNDGC